MHRAPPRGWTPTKTMRRRAPDDSGAGVAVRPADGAAHEFGSAESVVSRPRVAAWGPRAVVLVDQTLSSVSNLLVVVLVARVLSASDFGHFALGYAVLTLTLGLSRAYFGSRISLAPSQDAARRLTSALVAGMVVVAPAVSLAVLAVSALATQGQAPVIVLIVALATPVVCVQDALRFGAVAGGRPWAALLSDAAWIAPMLLPLVLGIDLQASSALILWASAAVVALLVALVAFGEPPRWGPGLRELRRRENVGAALALGAVVTTAATLLVLVVVSRVLGPAAAGSLRGASTAMGPVNVLLAFTALGVTPFLVRRPRGGDRGFCMSVAAVLVILVLLWGAVLLLLPDSIGTAAFGSSWPGIRSVLGWTVGEYVWVAVGAGAILGLKVRHRAGDLIRTRAATATATVVAGTAAATVARDLQSVAAALAVSAFVVVAVSWFLLLRSGDESRSPDLDPSLVLLDNRRA